ncbi:hypothetical protein [Actinomycetospora chiangmaiensis]|uniref:hypothetical protein n=1 Tax=Actinomycetospora chiangmaiensis TaxID=402650 RepID=UPI00037B65AE|nr:hypothetical protein [Actinomycetospora chiangmaiensis]
MTSAATPGPTTTASSGSAPTAVSAAVRAAQEVHTLRVEVPGIGEVPLPSADELAFVGGLVALGVVGALEWPLVAVLGVGRVLSHVHRWRSLAAFGDALEHA